MKEGWTYKKLGEVVTITMGQSPSSDTYNESEGLPFFQGNADFGKEHPNVRLFCNAPIRIADIDDVLISVRAPIGAINIADRKCCIGRGLASLRGNENYQSRFVYYFLMASKEKLVAQGTGSTFKSIGKDTLYSLLIPVVSLYEQSQIVKELDLLQSIIDKQQGQLKELDNLAQAIFHEMFGDPVENDKGWEVKQIGDVCLPKKEIKRATKQFDKDDEISYIDISAIDNSKNVITTPTSLRFGDAPSRAQQIVIKNDILISLVRPNLNNVALVLMDKLNLVASSGFCVLRTSRDVEPIFLFAIVKMKNFTDYLMQRVSGANYPAVREDDITEYKTIIPPLSLQQSFAEKIEAIEKQKANISKSIEETQKLFDYTMDKYFG